MLHMGRGRRVLPVRALWDGAVSVRPNKPGNRHATDRAPRPERTEAERREIERHVAERGVKKLPARKVEK